VDVPFDPAQDIIKLLNKDTFAHFKEEYGITSFNSINIARILAQTVYYFRAYTELLKQ
jgi:threonine synthase